MAKNEPRITVILPTYRRPKLLKRAIRSVLQQSFGDFRILVCDNASGDETQAVVSEFSRNDPRILYFRHERNLGPLQNIKFGLSKVETPLFCFLQDDDLLLPGFFEAGTRSLETHPSAGFFAGKTLAFNDQGKFLFAMPDGARTAQVLEVPKGVLKILSGDILGHFIWNSLLFRKEVLDKVSFEPEVGITSDVDFTLNVAARYPFVLVPNPVALLMVHPGNVHRTMPGVQFALGWIRVMNRLKNASDIPAGVRVSISRKFSRQLRRTLIKIWMKKVSARNFSEGFQLASLLEDGLDYPRASRFLEACTRWAKKMPIGGWLDRISFILNLGLNPSQENKVHRYQEYSHFLRDDEKN